MDAAISRGLTAESSQVYTALVLLQQDRTIPVFCQLSILQHGTLL